MFASIIVDSFFVVFLRKSTKEFSSFEITFAMLIEGAVAFNIINIFIHTYNGTLSDYFKPLFDIDMIIGFCF